ncbi:HAD family hydrolase [Geomobilimonas luticola]|uniref:HAD hydrolase-like protein n=1 Tax=Geomobilimonas luticola TaxID=1114878 RepID=A0ABS5SEF5_9BACT|nr:HAD family hydrolase [Geomobilimonas luticola]MBT0652889.1 HAD hydrolase-like protein [Geomobilimonas luticola]
MQINWNEIDTVLLDMDGTLLDRHFDDHFWLEHVPRSYAQKHTLSLQEAKDILIPLFRSQENTLNWTDLDYWSERLGLDIPLLKREVDHLIAVHPGVVEFLLFLSRHDKHIYLVTNAHSKTLELKMRKTRVGQYFTGIISAHELGLPKEEPAFWGKLRERIPYDPARTLLGEDSETNLSTAAAYNIAYLIYVSRFSSTVTPVPSPRYTSIHYFSQLIPPAGSLSVRL